MLLGRIAALARIQLRVNTTMWGMCQPLKPGRT